MSIVENPLIAVGEFPLPPSADRYDAGRGVSMLTAPSGIVGNKSHAESVMVGDLLPELERHATNRARIIAGGQPYRLRFTTVVVYRGMVMDISQVPIGETCRVVGDEGSDYTATVVA